MKLPLILSNIQQWQDEGVTSISSLPGDESVSVFTYWSGKEGIFRDETNPDQLAYSDVVNMIESWTSSLFRLVAPFKHALDFVPVGTNPPTTQDASNIRELRGDALSGIYFAWKFLVAVSLGNKDIPYPPPLVDRMVVDMSCHLFSSWGWHARYRDRLEAAMNFLEAANGYAKYLLESRLTLGRDDWLLAYLSYSPGDDKTFVWIPATGCPEKFKPRSTQHTSMVSADAAYFSFFVEGMGRIIRDLKAKEIPGSASS